MLLFHVDEMECNDDDLSIKLVMTVDRDLIMTFPDRYTCALATASQTPHMDRCFTWDGFVCVMRGSAVDMYEAAPTGVRCALRT